MRRSVARRLRAGPDESAPGPGTALRCTSDAGFTEYSCAGELMCIRRSSERATMTNESRTTRIRGAERVLAWDEEARGPLLAIALRRESSMQSRGSRRWTEGGGGDPRRRIARGDRRRRHRGDGHARHDQHPSPTSMAAVLATGFLEEVLDPRLRHSPMYTRIPGTVLEQRRGHTGARRRAVVQRGRCATRWPS